MIKNIKYLFLTSLTLGFLQLETSAMEENEDENPKLPKIITRSFEENLIKNANANKNALNKLAEWSYDGFVSCERLEANKSLILSLKEDALLKDGRYVELLVETKHISRFPDLIKENKKKAKIGDAVAQSNLFYMYWTGNGVKEKSYEKAYKWANRAYKNGCAVPQCFLAFRSEKENPRKAFERYKRASDYKIPSGILGVGKCYDKGIGVSTNKIKAIKYYLNFIDSNNIILSFASMAIEGIEKALEDLKSKKTNIPKKYNITNKLMLFKNEININKSNKEDMKDIDKINCSINNIEGLLKDSQLTQVDK